MTDQPIQVTGQAAVIPPPNAPAATAEAANAEASDATEAAPVPTEIDMAALRSEGLSLDPSEFNANQMMAVETVLNCDFERAVKFGLTADETLVNDEGRVVRFGEVTRAMIYAFLRETYPTLTIEEAGTVPFATLRQNKPQGEGPEQDG